MHLWSNESVQNVRLLSGSAPETLREGLASGSLTLDGLPADEARLAAEMLPEYGELFSPKAYGL